MSHYPAATHAPCRSRGSDWFGRLGKVGALTASCFAATFWLALPAQAATKIDSQFLGEWEVAKAQMPRSLSPQQRTMRENDPRLMSRTLIVGSDSVNFQRYEPDCSLTPMAAGKEVSIRVLFAKESGLKRPTAIKGSLYGRWADYELTSVKIPKVDLWQVTCKPIDGQKSPFANWIAVSAAIPGSAATVLFPKDYDALLVMKQGAQSTDRPNTTPTELCREPASASDKAICGNGSLLRLHRFALAARARVVSDRPDFNAGIDALNDEQLKNRQACNGDVMCLYGALDRQLFILGMNMTR